MYDKSTFSETFKKLISQRGMTQRAVADKLGTTEVTVSRYVAGARSPNLETMVELAQILNVSLNDLAGVEAPATARQAPDVKILISCYEKATPADRKVLWSLLDRYMTPEQRIVISSIEQDEEKVEAV